MEPGAEPEGRYTTIRYFGLVDEGLLAPDEKVELLDGIIVSMPPQLPTHASSVRRVERALRRALGRIAGEEPLLSSQLPLVLGSFSVPEPDVAVLPGELEDYDLRHPTRALLVVEVADSSLAQDRLTKTRIYARAGIPSYWIVNLRNRSVEWFAEPDADARVYSAQGIATGSMRLPIAAFPDAVVTADELLPPH